MEHLGNPLPLEVFGQKVDFVARNDHGVVSCGLVGYSVMGGREGGREEELKNKRTEINGGRKQRESKRGGEATLLE